MIHTYVTMFAGLLGLAFGSFLNVCLSRWPEEESIVHPRSHCRRCGHTLKWWENIPLVSWVGLRGRCRECRQWIGWRYPIVELTVGILWAVAASSFSPELFLHRAPLRLIAPDFVAVIGSMIFYWMLVALAALDAEHLWLPNVLTFPGIVIGFVYEVSRELLISLSPVRDGVTGLVSSEHVLGSAALSAVISIVVCAGLLLLIRWLYWIFRRREGMGLGDVKLIAMLAAWLGLAGALLAFFISALLGAIASLIVIAIPSKRDEGEGWATTKLPFGTFLCIGGIASNLWGQRIIAAYLHMIGF